MANRHLVPKKLKLGQLVQTAGVAARVAEDPAFELHVLASIVRHAQRDWGNLCEEDKKLNDEAFESGEARILSAYEEVGMPKIWIITEWDRSVTTVLFPDEY